MFGNHFYHNSLRKLVIAFGSLFNDVRIARYNSDGTIKEYIRLPISYGPKEKFLARINQPSSLSDGTKVEMTLPRMGFEITGINYDSGRKRNTMQRKIMGVSGDNWHRKYNYAEVPYNVDFSVYCMVRNTDDGLQFVEQVLPYFTPEFNITINVNELNQKQDIPIILTGVNSEEDYEGDFDSRRNITWTLNFTAKTNVYGEGRTSGTILKTKAIFFNYGGSGGIDYIFTATGGTMAGGTGALSRVDIGITGPSGASSDMVTGYSADASVYIFGSGDAGGACGAPYIDILGATI
jgi:hypothetical protein